MDQIKIGKFIASCRKEQGMTQASLAEKLGISDRAVSKWETGKSMPDSGIMLELCALLKINVNELLSGERIMAEAYDKRAEENLLAMRREVEEKNRQMLRTEYWIAIPAVIAGLVMVFVASFLEMPVWLRIALIVFALIMIFTVAFIAVGIEQKAGYYECQNCHHRYVPTYWQTNLAMHMGRTRYMKCPKCGKRSWQKKVLTKEEYGKRIKMGIYTYNVDTYNRLKELKDQIEAEFDENLNWEYSKSTGTTRSIVIEEKADVFNPAEQPKIFDWIIDHFDRITTALSMAGEHLSISGDSSETRFEIRKRYWTYALTQIHEAHGNPGSFSNVNPSTDNWINGFFGIGGFYLCCVANFDSARSEVVFARAERSENKAAFDALYQHKSEIESKLGTELQWNRGDDIKSSKVFIQLDNVSIENEDDWPQMAKFHAEWSKKFYDLIVPYITVDWQ